jgi:hypothetical protein
VDGAEAEAAEEVEGVGAEVEGVEEEEGEAGGKEAEGEAVRYRYIPMLIAAISTIPPTRTAGETIWN